MKQHNITIKRMLLFTLLALGACFMSINEASATHAYGGQLKWQQAGGNKIQFTFTSTWRASAFGSPTVGTVLNGLGSLNTGYPGAASLPINAVVTTVDAVNDQIYATWTGSYTYPATGNYTAQWDLCCRISTLLDGNNDQNTRFQTIVNVGPPYNNPPVSSLPNIVFVSIGQSAATFSIPGSDPDGNNITYRLSTSAESSLPTVSPAGFSLASNGVVTMNTTTRSVGQRFAVQVMIVDGFSKTPVDFIIQMVGTSAPPFFVAPTPMAPNNNITVLPGNNVSFTVAARDNDANSTVRLNAVPLPVGASITPTLPVTGALNGTVSATFSWTPTSAQVGNYVLTFPAVDNVGVQALNTVNITVACALDAQLTSSFVNCGTNINATITNFSSTANLLYSWSGPNGFTANTQNITNVAPGTYTLRVNDAGTGCLVVKNITVASSVPAPTITANGSTTICQGSSVTLTASAGSSYLWSNGATTQSINVNTPGNYTVTVTNASGCQSTSAATTVSYQTGLDTDGDGIPNTCDADDDNDGIPDVVECNKSNFFWSNPPTVSGNTATGVINGVSYTYTSSSPVETTSTVFAHNLFPTSYGIPNIQCIKNVNASNNTLTFATPVTNPILVFASIGGGQPSPTVPIEFTNPIDVLWSQNVVINSSTKITGTEGYAIVRLNGTYSSISFNYLASENWVNFLFGADIQTCGDTDGDGTPDYLDTDSDNDGCPDAIEGTQNPTMAQTANGRLTGGVDASGIPTLVNGGQGIGTSQNANANCFCQVNIDKTAPVITCPDNITANATNANGAVVNYAMPTATDNCAVTFTRTAGPASGATFPIGTTTVTYRATDEAGNFADCSFTVTVSGLAPQVVCPTDITVNSTSGQNGAIVNFAATETVGIPASVITYSHASGSLFPIGVTTVTATATNAVGVSSCTFTVTVKDGEAPIVKTQNKTVYLDASGNASITAADIDNGSTDNVGITNLSLSQSNFNCSNLSKALQLSSSSADGVTSNSNLNITGNAARTFSAWVKPSALNNMWGVVHQGNNDCSRLMFGLGLQSGNRVTFWGGCFDIVSSLTAPTNQWSYIAVVYNGSGGFTLYLNGTAQSYSIGTLNTQLSKLFIGHETTNNGGNFRNQYEGAIDEVKVYNRALTPAEIAIDRAGSNPAGSNLILYYPFNDGGGTVITDVAGGNNGTLISPTANNWVAGATSGTVQTVLTATDAAGNSASAAATVTVLDTIRPVINCQASINVFATSAAGAVVNYTLPTATDNCTATVTLISGPASGAVFPIGTTTVTYRATDASGNTADCSFTVTVTGLPPQIVSPGNQTASAALGTCGAVVNFTATETTAIPASTITYSHQPGSVFPVGVTTVTATATNPVGTSQVTFTVTVTDNQNPTIGGLSAITVNADNGSCAATGVALGTPVTADNCGVASVSNNAPASYPVGNTTVTWTVTDVNGNSTTTTQVVTVKDNQNPTIGGLSAITVNADNGSCAATGVALGTPTTGDNCGVASVSNNAPASYPVGNTTVTWTVTDVNGNSTTTTQVVTVKDNQNPTIGGLSAITVNADNGSCAATGVALGTPTTGDNCGVASVSNNAPASYPVGNTTVTWTVTDVNGNSTTTTQVVTVKDNQNPTIGGLSAITVNADNGSCAATGVALGTPTTGDNCGVASVSNNAPASYPVGNTTVTWTVTDVNGNSTTTTQVVTVKDNQAPTVRVNNVTVTLVNGSASVNAAQINNGSSDNCGIQSVVLSGKMNYSCADIGQHTVTLTVTDIHGNVASANAVVTVAGVIPAASITAIPSNSTYTGGVPTNLYLGYGPQSLRLQVNATGGAPYSYSWTGNGSLSSTTAADPVFTATVAGNYTFVVTVTNVNGCTTTATVSICVRDIRVPGTNGNNAKVYLCHVPPGNAGNPQTLSISVNAVASHLTQHSGDRLGTCGMLPCSVASAPGGVQEVAKVEGEGHEHETDLEVIASPNPTMNYFELLIQSADKTTPVQVRVTSMNGRVLTALKATVGQKVRFGQEYTSGTYVAEAIQGNKRKTVKLIKGR